MAANEASYPRTVLLMCPTFPALEESISKRFHVLRAWEPLLPLPDFIAVHVGDVEALVTRAIFFIDADILESLPALKLIVTNSVGVSHIDMAMCARRGIAVANAGNVFTEEVAEYAVGLLIDVLRRISAADRYVRGGLWQCEGVFPLGSKLGGKRVGIVGLGNVGSKVATMLEAFGCIISYYSRKRKPSFSYAFHPSVRDLAAHCDILVICCALSSETHHIVDGDAMEALGKGGIIINIGRGAVVDEREMVRRLMHSELGGAGLDVFEDEPVVSSELFSMDNVVLSPHAAVFTHVSFADQVQFTVDNLEAFFSNKPLLSRVN